MKMSHLSCLIVLFLAQLIFLTCSSVADKNVDSYSKYPININMIHVLENGKLELTLEVKAEQDSVKLEKLEIMYPSFLVANNFVRSKPILLNSGEKSKIKQILNITQNKSFKIKGIAFASHKSGNQKIDIVTYLFFFWDSDHFIVASEPKDLIGKKKKNGELINKDELSVFNQVESN